MDIIRIAVRIVLMGVSLITVVLGSYIAFMLALSKRARETAGYPSLSGP